MSIRVEHSRDRVGLERAWTVRERIRSRQRLSLQLFLIGIYVPIMALAAVIANVRAPNTEHGKMRNG
jgi:hypothetical protein